MRPIIFATGVALILQVAASLAQQPPPNEPAHKVYVMSGCLERVSAPTSVFKLVDATSIGQAPPTVPSNRAAEVGAETRSYDLLPVSSVSEQGVNRETLDSHVGNRVEVTMRPMEPAIATSTTTSTSSTTAAKVEQPTPRRYTVVKISKAAGECNAR